jgi:hypothetical protein
MRIVPWWDVAVDAGAWIDVDDDLPAVYDYGA